MFYLDNAATTWPKPEVVYRVWDQSFRELFSPKRGTAKASRAGAERLAGVRQSLATLLNIRDPDRICFTGGCTHALNLAIQGFPWEPGDGVILSALEHHALSRPVRKMVREKGIRFHVVPYREEMPFDRAAYEALLKMQQPIRLVAVTHASNVIGSLLPVREIGRLARQYNALFLVDAAQTAGGYPVDVQAMEIDLLAVPGHKGLYGPPGVGALYMGPAVRLNTFLEGGTGNDSGRHVLDAIPPDGFEVGTIPLPQILTLGAGVAWVLETGVDTIRGHEEALLDRLLRDLREFPEVTIHGHTRVMEKMPVVSFSVEGFDPKVLGAKLFDEAGVALRAGFHCAPMAHEAIGTLDHGGTLRVSIGYFTRPEDIAALITALKSALAPRMMSPSLKSEAFVPGD